MFERRYNIFFDDIWFDSLYGADYYLDKPNFFAHGAKQFFTIYQIFRNGDFSLTIVEVSSGAKLKINDLSEFETWVVQNYDYFKNHLNEIYWDNHPDSRLN
jgi:hypothetical protein